MIKITPEYLASQGFSETLPKRFFAKVKKTSTCWWWIGATNNAGYGKISPIGRDTTMLAHRISYILHYGPIPKGLFVCHLCDRPCCVNPEHLFVGTSRDNWIDSRNKGRDGHGIMRGSKSVLAKLTEDQVSHLRKSLVPGSKGITKQIRDAAIHLGVSLGCLNKIIYRQTWLHV